MLFGFLDLGWESTGVSLDGGAQGSIGSVCAWYQSWMVAALRFAARAVRFGRRWGVDLSSWANRGRVPELDRP